MQYDVQRSSRTSVPGKASGAESKASRPAKASGKASKAARGAEPAPRLRDRLFEVLERDRALSEADVGPELETIDPRDAEAKSGTHARLPGYQRSRHESEDREPTQRVPTRISAPPPLPSRRQTVAPPAPQHDDTQDDDSLRMFASWIEEELVELDPITDEPLVLDGATPALRELDLAGEPSGEELVATLEPSRAAPELVLDLTEDDGLPMLESPRPEPMHDLAQAITTESDTEDHAFPMLVSRASQAKPSSKQAAGSSASAVADTSESEPERVEQEPIRTRTMAKLLAGHGYRARALSIYDFLITQDPDDLELLLEAEALRSKK